jgi:hypothetical protein
LICDINGIEEAKNKNIWEGKTTEEKKKGKKQEEESE